MIKKLFLSTLLLISAVSWAELPSWGMTENQFKLPNFSQKMKEIGQQAFNKNWMLKVTAPDDWHDKIRAALTQGGEKDVQLTFKDSLHKSIAISAVPGAKIAKITPSNGSGATVKKQVVIEKPDIDTAVDAPDFGDTQFQSNTDELLENINAMELTLPTTHTENKQVKKSVAVKEVVAEKVDVVEKVADELAKVEQSNAAESETVDTVAAAVQPAQTAKAPAIDETKNVAEVKEALRKRHARSKRVDKQLSYNSIREKDELFVDGSVVLIKRFFSQGVVVYYWMRESYDPSIHKIVEKGSGKFKKDPTAVQGSSPVKNREVAQEKVQPTNLDFIAIDTVVEDKDDLRRDHIRSKRVDNTISASKLKKDDVLYVKNQTVLVVRPVTRSQSVYYWLVGDTNISRGVERKGENRFFIK